MKYKDYYSILGVDKHASDVEIKQAYRKLARELHPDVNPGDKDAEEKFKEINEASQVLSNPEKRQKYDTLSAQRYERWQPSRGQGQAPYPNHFKSDLGKQRGGNVRYEYRNRRVQPRRGEDLETQVEIKLAEAYSGTNRVIQTFDDAGAVKRLEAWIPPGVDDGSRVRLTGKGSPGVAGAPSGDLYLDIRVTPHAYIHRRKDDLRMTVDVPLLTAILGGEVEIATIEDKNVALTIPPETQNGNVFLLRGKGMPRAGRSGERGDYHAEVNVVLPQNLSEKQRDMYRQMARVGDTEPLVPHVPAEKGGLRKLTSSFRKVRDRIWPSRSPDRSGSLQN